MFGVETFTNFEVHDFDMKWMCFSKGSTNERAGDMRCRRYANLTIFGEERVDMLESGDSPNDIATADCTNEWPNLGRFGLLKFEERRIRDFQRRRAACERPLQLPWTTTNHPRSSRWWLDREHLVCIKN